MFAIGIRKGKPRPPRLPHSRVTTGFRARESHLLDLFKKTTSLTCFTSFQAREVNGDKSSWSLRQLVKMPLERLPGLLDNAQVWTHFSNVDSLTAKFG